MKAAIYARFSTDRQSESSIADQVRVCTERAQREGMQITKVFKDEGISGAATGNRPGYNTMMAGAKDHAFDTLLVMDLSRLSRSQADLAKTLDRLAFIGIRVIGCHDGFDSEREGASLVSGLSGILGQSFREMVAKKTHAALETRAKDGRATGGRIYGYGPGEADVVRRIFQMYADGRTSRQIAITLNAEGIPSPGSSWKRVERRTKGWCASCIHGDPEAGTGILNAEVYIGREVWNRRRFTKDPDTGKRKAILRPRSEWIVREVPEKKIITMELWEAVKRRQAAARQGVGGTISAKLKRRSGGPAPRYLLSRILRCGCCSGPFAVVNSRAYACSRKWNTGICESDIYLPIKPTEDTVLAELKAALLSKDAEAEFIRRVRKALTAPNPDAARAKALRVAIDRMVDAIASGVSSMTLRARLETAERELAEIESRSTVTDVSGIVAKLPALAARYRAMVNDLGNAPIDVERARGELLQLVGPLTVRREGDAIFAESDRDAQPVKSLKGNAYITVVAGAGFEPATFGL